MLAYSPEEFENRRRNRASFVHYVLNHSEKLTWQARLLSLRCQNILRRLQEGCYALSNHALL